jgi:hypothetical protein
MATIEVESRVLGARPQDGLRSVFFDAVGERITVRALILRTVEEQVRDVNGRRELTRQEVLRQFARQYQTEDEIRALRTESGQAAFPTRSTKPRTINVEQAQKQALEGFRSGRFVVFVGDEQMANLDQPIELRTATKVQFLRVLPLQGGVGP